MLRTSVYVVLAGLMLTTTTAFGAKSRDMAKGTYVPTSPSRGVAWLSPQPEPPDRSKASPQPEPSSRSAERNDGTRNPYELLLELIFGSRGW